MSVPLYGKVDSATDVLLQMSVRMRNTPASNQCLC